MRRFSRISTIIALALIASLSAGCKKKKKAMPWLFFGAQQQTNPVDSNGNPLPNNQPSGQQEVATSGPALITGSVVAMDGDSQDTGFDYSSVEVQLVDPDGNVIATVHLDNSGQYSFQIPDLENNNYRVLIPSGQGLQGNHADFNYVYDPTSSPTLKEVAPIYAQITTFSMGPCVIAGSVESPGYSDGIVTVTGGPLAGITVILYNSNGNPVSQSTTDANGNFTFDLRNPENWLVNGNYVIVAYGSEQESSGRPYKDVASGVDFIFQGNIQSTPTQISAGKLISAWDAATASDANINGSIYNVALDVAMDGFQVSLLSGNGTVLDTDTTNAAGEFELSETLGNGVYSIRVQKEGFQSVTTSVQFTARADGAETDINPEPIGVRPNNSKIIGQITDAATGNRVDGAVLSFRPAQDQPVERLQYLLDDPDLAAAAQRWIDEKQATGKYSTYLTQSYEVSGDHLETTGVPGKWRFYISAPGYRPSSDPAGADTGNVIVLNGTDVHRSVALQSTTTRSRIQGRATITDTLVDG
ncbi:MAG: hypothetical protein KDK33_15170, partial [Leptospiraceae bacterium]|nr:hypothetical protein [Leptospiraceae bacterium]